MTDAPSVPADRSWLSGWDRWFFAPESPSPMALVRAAWGVTAAIWAISLLPDVDPFLTKGKLQYLGNGPGVWNPLTWISWRQAPLAVCVLLIPAALATAVGYRTRFSSALAVLCMLALERTNIAMSNSGDLVLRSIGLVVVLAPCGLVFSVDAVRARRRQRAEGVEHAPAPRRAPWARRLLQIHIAVGYALSCWAKLGGNTWYEGTALGYALRVHDLSRAPVPGFFFDHAVLVNLATWGTLLFEASFVFLVWNKRWRPWVLTIGVLFHLGIDLFIDVGFLSYAMLISYLAFLPPETADKVVAWLTERLGRLPLVRRRPSPELEPQPG